MTPDHNRPMRALLSKSRYLPQILATAGGILILANASSTQRCWGQQYAAIDQKQAIESGKMIFQKEWQHDAPTLTDRGQLSDSQYAAMLRVLPGDGLGPMFNAKSCEACHAGGAGADVDRNVTLITLDPRSPGLASVASPSAVSRRIKAEDAKQLGKSIDDLFPAFISPGGILSMDVVVHEASAREFYKPLRQQLADGVSQGIAPEWFDSAKRTSRAIADRPVIAGRQGGLDYYLSQRNSPPLFGVGLIDKIQMSRLLNIARVQATRSHGKVTGRVGDGKFGWRAQSTSLHNFVMGACAGELGLQVPGTSQPPDFADLSYVSMGDDLSAQQVMQLTSYVGSLPAPIQERSGIDHWNGVRHGKRLFGKIGCAACHIENVSPARGIYSDLLLHDMGELLQAPSPASRGRLKNLATISTPRFPRDERSFGSSLSVAGYYGGGSAIEAYAFVRPAEAKFPYGRLPLSAVDVTNDSKLTWDVLQREWRTPPLWGVADSAPYLHDGRATTLDAAIRWHAGEASGSVSEYRSLDKNDKQLVMQFLKSLRGPVSPRVPDELKPIRKQELASKAISPQPSATDSDDPLAAFSQAY